VHLGLGNFFRAHQAWYTDCAPDAQEWGIAAFTGRGAELANALAAQEGLYTLITRAADGDRFQVVSSLSRAHAAADHAAWLSYFSSPEVHAITVTVTEAGYLRGADGGLDRERPEVRADVETLRRDFTAAVSTAPARLLAGVAARRRADAGRACSRRARSHGGLSVYSGAPQVRLRSWQSPAALPGMTQLHPEILASYTCTQ